MPTRGLRTTVVVPTSGRRKQLSGALASIAALDPAPAEVILVDQGGSGAARQAAEGVSGPSLRVIEDEGHGAARARNLGAKAADAGLLLFTDDDCHPRQDWIEVALRLHERRPEAVLTGSVVAGGDAAGVPSLRDDPRPHDYTGSRTCGALYSGNMIVSSRAFTEFGGFDERFPSAGGEDNDFCYRWLRAGRTLLYEPELVVTHVDWRGDAGMAAVRREYARTQGMFYAKHLRLGDAWMLRFLLGDLSALLRQRVLRQSFPAPGAPALGAELRSITQHWGTFAPARD